jgi:D-serine deaminase-like pyridoxal phosphate-dependent protein
MHLPFGDFTPYRFAHPEAMFTPALAIYESILDQNIEAMKRVVGRPDRWRPHVKTSKLQYTMRRLVDHGVGNLKCTTTLELSTACRAGAKDVVVAYPVSASASTRVAEIAAEFPAVAVSGIVETKSQLDLWRGKRVDLFIDVNPGMDRTGIDVARTDEIVALARSILSRGIRFRGIHYYEGHHNQPDLQERTRAAHAGYDVLIKLLKTLESSGVLVEEVITSGTPALPCALSYAPFNEARFLHRVSPGTVVYGDVTSAGQLPASCGLRPAAIVLSTVVSRPTANRFTCDAGHKTVSADAGIPNCAVIGYPGLEPLKPSEEHLPIDLAEGGTSPEIGELLYLVPRHVCPTVNNFDHALIIRDGQVAAVEQVTSRGREAPLAESAVSTSC